MLHALGTSHSTCKLCNTHLNTLAVLDTLGNVMWIRGFTGLCYTLFLNYSCILLVHEFHNSVTHLCTRSFTAVCILLIFFIYMVN